MADYQHTNNGLSVLSLALVSEGNNDDETSLQGFIVTKSLPILSIPVVLLASAPLKIVCSSASETVCYLQRFFCSGEVTTSGFFTQCLLLEPHSQTAIRSLPSHILYATLSSSSPKLLQKNTSRRLSLHVVQLLSLQNVKSLPWWIVVDPTLHLLSCDQEDRFLEKLDATHAHALPTTNRMTNLLDKHTASIDAKLHSVKSFTKSNIKSKSMSHITRSRPHSNTGTKLRQKDRILSLDSIKKHKDIEPTSIVPVPTTHPTLTRAHSKSIDGLTTLNLDSSFHTRMVPPNKEKVRSASHSNLLHSVHDTHTIERRNKDWLKLIVKRSLQQHGISSTHTDYLFCHKLIYENAKFHFRKDFQVNIVERQAMQLAVDTEMSKNKDKLEQVLQTQ